MLNTYRLSVMTGIIVALHLLAMHLDAGTISNALSVLLTSPHTVFMILLGLMNT